MTEDEKLLVITSRIHIIDNMIMQVGHENKNEEDSILHMNLVLRKKALINFAQSIDPLLKDSLENQG